MTSKLLLKITTGMTAAFLSTTAQAETRYFVGEYTCNTAGVANLALTDIDAGKEVTIWFRLYDNSRWNGSKADLEWAGGTQLLTNRFGMTLTEIGEDKISAQWLNRRAEPNPECSTFELDQTDTPLERFQTFSQEATEAAPRPDVARDLTARYNRLPPAEMVPELDRTVAAETLQTAWQDYWSQFETARQEMIDGLGTDATKEEFASVAAMLAPDLDRDGSLLNDYRDMRQLAGDMATLANRRDQAGFDPREALITGPDFCTRLSHRANDRQEKIEVAGAVPFDFWTRDIAQQVIDTLRRCDEDNTADWVAQNFPSIMAKGEERAALVAEIDRLVALPASRATLAETNGLMPSREFLRGLNRDEADVHAIGGARLAQARDAALAQTESSLEAEIAELVAQDPDPQWLNAGNLCYGLVGKQRILEPFYETCKNVAATKIDEARHHRAKVAAEATLAEVVASAERAQTPAEARAANWFALPYNFDQSLVDPETLSDAQSRIHAATTRLAEQIMPMTKEALAQSPDTLLNASDCGSSHNVPPVVAAAITACQTEVNAHNTAVTTRRCDQRMAEVGAEKYGTDQLAIPSLFGGQTTLDFRQFFCKELPKTEATLNKSGWFGKKLSMTLDLGAGPVTAELEPSETNDTIWVIQAVEGYTPPPGESPALCLFDPRSCSLK